MAEDKGNVNVKQPVAVPVVGTVVDPGNDPAILNSITIELGWTTITGITNINVATATKKNDTDLNKAGDKFIVHGIPGDIRDKGITAKNEIQNLVNSGAVYATKVVPRDKKVTEVANPGPIPLGEAIQMIADAVTNGAKKFEQTIKESWTNPKPIVPKAPLNIRDAVKKIKGVAGMNDRHVEIPPCMPTKPSKTSTKPNSKPGFIGLGAHMEFKPTSISLSVGGKGFMIDRDGNMHMPEKTHLKEVRERQYGSGFPATRNGMSQMVPKMGYTGVPIMDTLPSFDIINWLFKIYQIWDILRNVSKESNSYQPAGQAAIKDQLSNSKDKIR